MIGGAMLPWFATVPMSVLVLALLWAHLMTLGQQTEMDATRQRIRQANGVVMMLLVVMMTAGLSLLSWRANPSLWIMVWASCVVLLLTMIAMATLDAMNTARMARERREELRAWLLGNHEQADEPSDG